MSQESDIYFDTINNAGVVTLNRPTALNALTLSMVSNMFPKLQEWERNKTCVIVKGAGKAFCAGGDVKMVTSVNGEGFQMAYIEYNTDYLIKKYRIPYIALASGFTMGAGLGLLVHGRYRVATETTVISMPETQLGILPDVGGTYFLPRLRQHLGFYMGLTGKRLKGKDIVASGIATHFVQSNRLLDLEMQLSRCTADAEIVDCLSSFNEPAGEFSLAGQMNDIDHCFSADTIEEIIRRLSTVNNQWASETLKILARVCPTMLKVSLRALHLGRHLDLRQCLQQEYRVNSRCFLSHNLREGVRARLIDRDEKPRWQPATLAEVTEEEVKSYFEKLPEDKELKFYDTKL